LSIRDRLQGGANLTFGHLRTLCEQVPGIRKLTCTGTALYSGPGVVGKVPQLAVFRTDDEDHAAMEISEAAVISAALPFIFKQRRAPMPHDLAGDAKTKTRFIDGGLTLNTPVHELIDPDAPPAESLVIGLEHWLLTQAREGTQAAPTPLLTKVLDTLVIKTNANNQQYRGSYKFVANELVNPPLADQTVEAQLKGVAGSADYDGSKGTLALAMTRQEKDALQDGLQARILEHLEGRTGDITYTSLDHLVFSLPDDQREVLDPAWRGCPGGGCGPARSPGPEAVVRGLQGHHASLAR
jgi:predicted acylesterase/phospholipase RssA